MISSLTPTDQYPPHLREVVDWAVALFGCSKARVSTFDNQPALFLIIGWPRHTRDLQRSVWRNEQGERIDFEYTEEQCIACGDTVDELKACATEYHRLSQLTAHEHVQRLLTGKP